MLPLATFRTKQFLFASIIYNRKVFVCFKCKHSGKMLNITLKEVPDHKYRISVLKQAQCNKTTTSKHTAYILRPFITNVT